MTCEQSQLKTNKITVNQVTSTFILVDIKAGLRSNSELLEVNLTRRAAKIKVLDGYAYPELRLFNSRCRFQQGSEQLDLEPKLPYFQQIS